MCAQKCDPLKSILMQRNAMLLRRQWLLQDDNNHGKKTRI